MLFSPQNFDPPSAEQTLQFARGFNRMISIMICIYVIELASDTHMRTSLVAHHLTVILLTLWGAAVIYDVKGVAIPRLLFAMTLHMTTEQNFFLTMLAYRSNFTMWLNAVYASAILFVVIRVVITAVGFWAWSDAILVVWSGDPYSFISYAVLVFFPFGSTILNVCQVETVRALFGIAHKVGRCRLTL